MANYLIEHQIRIRNRADSSDLLTVTSVRGGTNPYLEDTPTGDGASLNAQTGESLCASYRGTIVDAITSGTTRVVTSQLEDVNNRLQLGFLKAYVEYRRDGGSWNVLCAGYLVVLRMTDAIRWEFTIQDANRVLNGVQLFTAASTTNISTFLSTWPNRGCLFGGPIKGSFLQAKDFGGWQMRVKAYTNAASRTCYWLQPVNCYGPPDWTKTGRIMYGIQTINAVGIRLAWGVKEVDMKRALPFSTIGDTYARGVSFPGLVYLIGGVAFRPIAAPDGGNFNDQGIQSGLLGYGTFNGAEGAFAILDNQTALTDGALVRVQALSILPTDFSPIYVDSHPVDLLTDMWTAAGLAYDSMASAALKDLIGGGLRIAGRITQSESLGEFLQKWVFGWAGIGVRINTSGQLVPFSTRIFSTSAPTKTITDAMVVSDSPKMPFEQDIGAGIARAVLRQQMIILNADTPDSVAEQRTEMTILNEDANALLAGVVEYDVPGMIRTSPSSYVPADKDWFQGIAYQLFDRWGRGPQALEVDLIRGDGTTDADTLNLGDEALVRPSWIPNHNKRYGDDTSVGGRAMQIVRVTELLDRRRTRFLDSGPNNQVGTAPTLTLAASSYLPRTVAEITITNAAALNASSYSVQIQMAVVTSGGSAPAAGDYHDVYESARGSTPTTAIRLPGVIAGYKVYVRARSKIATLRPSAWSSTANVTLTALDAVTGLAAASVTGDGSAEDLSWTLGSSGSTDTALLVWVRTSGAAFSTATRIRILPIGSTRFRMEGLTPNTAYTATVQHFDQATGDVSAVTDVTFTTANSTRALNPPTSPIGFSGLIAVS